MDIQKSQRLSQYMGVVSDMVAYEDIKDYMVHAKVISETEGTLLKRKLQVEGNVATMNELLTMINLRRGGFDAFLSALRQTDYVWIAEQLDPGMSYTGSAMPSTGNSNADRHSSSLQNFVKRISRKSEPAIGTSQDDIIYTSYRGTDSCPIDIPINPSFYENLSRNQFPESEMLNPAPSLAQEDKDALGMLKSLTLKSTLKKEVIIHNFDPGLGHIESTDPKQNNGFESLVKLAKVPSPLLKDLKVLAKGKISKKKGNNATKKIKLSFASEVARKEFVHHLQDFIANLKPTEPIFNSMKDVKVSIPEEDRKLRQKRDDPQSQKTSKPSTRLSSSLGDGVKKRWYKKSFRLYSTKKTQK